MGAFSACSESGTELWLIVRNRSDGLTTIIQFLDLLLKIAARTFEHRAVSGIAAAFELLNHVLQRQLEALFSRSRSAASLVRRGFSGIVLAAASSCCASTDLLSQPRAIATL